jgi:hypothetical protein
MTSARAGAMQPQLSIGGRLMGESGILRAIEAKLDPCGVLIFIRRPISTDDAAGNRRRVNVERFRRSGTLAGRSKSFYHKCSSPSSVRGRRQCRQLYLRLFRGAIGRMMEHPGDNDVLPQYLAQGRG